MFTLKKATSGQSRTVIHLGYHGHFSHGAQYGEDMQAWERSGVSRYNHSMPCTTSGQYPVAKREAVADYRANRENGRLEDNPSEAFPCDGVCEWGPRLGSTNFNAPIMAIVRYTEGPGDRTWMEAKDRNYLRRLKQPQQQDKKKRPASTKKQPRSANKKTKPELLNYGKESESRDKTLRPELIITNVLKIKEDIEAQEIEGKEVILVVGNTGSGKSTFVNYLAGCEMYEIETHAGCEIGIEAKKAIMKIGHTNKSETAEPNVYSDDQAGLTYCDCPGFFDNRGPEFTIPNAYAIREIAQRAGSIKGIIVMIDYHALDSDRLKSVRDTIKMLQMFFGVREEEIKANRSAIRIVITKAHEILDITAEDLKLLLSSPDNDLITTLASNLLFYDPLDRGGKGPKTRQEILNLLRGLPGITSREGLFGFALGVDSRVALNKFAEFLEWQIYEQLKQGELGEVNEKFTILQELRILDAEVITNVCARLERVIRSTIRSMEGTDEAISVLEKIRDNFPYFEKAAEEALEIILRRVEASGRRQADLEAAESARAELEAERVLLAEKVAQSQSEILRLEAEAAIIYIAGDFNRVMQNWEVKIQSGSESIGTVITHAGGGNSFAAPHPFYQRNTWHIGNKHNDSRRNYIRAPRVPTLTITNCETGKSHGLTFRDSIPGFTTKVPHGHNDVHENWHIAYQPKSIDIKENKLVVCLASTPLEKVHCHSFERRGRHSTSFFELREHYKVVIVDLKSGAIEQEIIPKRTNNQPIGVKFFEEGIFIKYKNNTHEVFTLDANDEATTYIQRAII